MCGIMVDIQSATAEIRRGKKNKLQYKNIMSAAATQGGHNNSGCLITILKKWDLQLGFAHHCILSIYFWQSKLVFILFLSVSVFCILCAWTLMV